MRARHMVLYGRGTAGGFLEGSFYKGWKGCGKNVIDVITDFTICNAFDMVK